MTNTSTSTPLTPLIRNGADRTLSTTVDVLVILLLPAVLLILNNTWIFVSPYGTDPWVYAGFHLHLRALLEHYWFTYYAARTPWNLLGWAALHLLAVEPALYLLHFFVFYVAIFSLYFAIRQLFFNRFAAISAAVLLATQPLFLSGLGWAYVDGAYCACILLSIATLARAAIAERPQAAAALWGGATTLYISLYVLFAAFVPVELAMWFLLNRSAGQTRNFKSVAIFFIAGALGTALLLGGLNVLAGGPFLYFMPQLTLLPTVAANRQRWINTPDLSIGNAQWLIVPTAVAGFCLLAMRRWWRSPRLLSVALGCVGVSLIFVVLEANHFIVLLLHDKVNALLPFDMLVIGAVLTEIAGAQTRNRALLIALLGLTLAPWVLGAYGVVIPPPNFFIGPATESLWIAIGITVLMLATKLTNRLGYMLIVAFFACTGVGAAEGFSISHGGKMMTFPAQPLYKQETLVVFDASREIAKYDQNTRARFWFNANNSLVDVERGVNSTYLAAYNLVNENFPSLVDKNGERTSVRPGDRIIVLAPSGNLFSQAQAAVSSEHIRLRQVAVGYIQRPGVRLEFMVADAELDLSRYAYEEALNAREVQLLPGPPRHADRWPVLIRTPAEPWAYAAFVRIPPYTGPGNRRDVAIGVHTSAVAGEVWIGILTRDEKSFVARVVLDNSERERNVYLSGIDLRNASTIVVQNGAKHGASAVTLGSVRLLVAGPP